MEVAWGIWEVKRVASLTLRGPIREAMMGNWALRRRVPAGLAEGGRFVERDQCSMWWEAGRLGVVVGV